MCGRGGQYGLCMTSTEIPDDFGFDDGDALASVDTGVDGQRVMVSGWSHSNVDTGTAGPHVALRGHDGPALVFSSRQITDLVSALVLVRDRIDRQFDNPVADSD